MEATVYPQPYSAIPSNCCRRPKGPVADDAGVADDAVVANDAGVAEDAGAVRIPRPNADSKSDYSSDFAAVRMLLVLECLHSFLY